MVETVKFFWTPEAAITNPVWLCRTEKDLPVGGILDWTWARPGADRDMLRRAYEAPVASGTSKAGPRRFPWCIPLGGPETDNAIDQQHCSESRKHGTKPANVTSGDRDHIFNAGGGAGCASQVTGATFDTFPNASHCCQEDNGEAIVEIFLQRQGAR